MLPLQDPEDIVFAPPRMAFASARGGNKTLENDKGAKDPEGQDRFSFRTRNGDPEADRFRDGRNSTLRRRMEGDQDSDGWSTVKPRKSFGHEGAERFHGKMGGNFREEKRQPREDRDPARERPPRNFDSLLRNKGGEDPEASPRNGLNRNRTELWQKDEVTERKPEGPNPEKRERIDRAKSWRDREKEPETSDDRGSGGRSYERRWPRDQRAEREPEWLDEPLHEEQPEAHTQQDFQKWMDDMKRTRKETAGTDKSAAIEAAEVAIEAVKPPVQSAPAVEMGPDKFFMAFASNAGLDASTPGEQKEVSSRPKPAGKSSRFTSFFSHAQEEVRGKTEPPTPMSGPPLSDMTTAPAHAPPPAGQTPAPEEERQAFQQLLAKLQKQTMGATPPGPSPFSLPMQGTPTDAGKHSAIASPESFQPYGGERRDGPLGRPPPQHVQEILAPRPQPQSARPEQLLQDLVGQRQPIPSQGPGRPDPSRNTSNTEFLMNLMRAGPGPQREEPLHMRLPQMQKQVHMPPMNERELEYPRDVRGPPRHMRPQPPPGFHMEEPPFQTADADVRPHQPTQILQRPQPPPGLDQMAPNWLPGGAQLPPPQQRGPMIPPPGLAGGPTRNIPIPHMFSPNFPPGAIPPPEALGGLPPRNMPLPPMPPGFFNGPPHGFMPPGLGGFNGPPGPDAHPFVGSPFEGRGMPPAGNPGRGAFGRP